MLMDDKHKEMFLTAKEISECFRIPLNTVYRLSNSGKIKGVKIGKQWRYARNDIEKYLSGELDVEGFNIYPEKEVEERRAYPRMNCNFQCRYRINIPPQEDFISYGSIKNISGGGVFLHDTADKLELIQAGDPIDIIIDFIPDTKRQEAIIDTKGRVVRKTRDGLGIKFRNIKDEFKDLIVQHVG